MADCPECGVTLRNPTRCICGWEKSAGKGAKGIRQAREICDSPGCDKKTWIIYAKVTDDLGNVKTGQAGEFITSERGFWEFKKPGYELLGYLCKCADCYTADRERKEGDARQDLLREHAKKLGLKRGDGVRECMEKLHAQGVVLPASVKRLLAASLKAGTTTLEGDQGSISIEHDREDTAQGLRGYAQDAKRREVEA